MHEPKRISPNEAHALLSQGYEYLDVRTEEEFADGHPTGAINIPFATKVGGTMTPNPQFVAQVSAKYPKDAKLVLGCRSGGRSLNASRALLAAGFTNIVDQRAGWDGVRDPFGQLTEPGWSRVGLPTKIGNEP